jgi:hypothetical protein
MLCLGVGGVNQPPNRRSVAARCDVSGGWVGGRPTAGDEPRGLGDRGRRVVWVEVPANDCPGVVGHEQHPRLTDDGHRQRDAPGEPPARPAIGVDVAQNRGPVAGGVGNRRAKPGSVAGPGRTPPLHRSVSIPTDASRRHTPRPTAVRSGSPWRRSRQARRTAHRPTRCMYRAHAARSARGRPRSPRRSPRTRIAASGADASTTADQAADPIQLLHRHDSC